MSSRGSAGPDVGRSDAETLVVATPELVTFRFETAGLGSRFAAQLIDLVVLWGLLAALALASFLLAVLTRNPVAGVVVFVVLGFAAFWGYLIVPEIVCSGQTLGKYVLRLRVIDQRGGPLNPGQAIVRNLLRVVDFLPVYYAVGAIAIFVSRRNQRLGDLAAGTVVVRERMAVRLGDLAAAPSDERQVLSAPRPVRRLEPELQRFVVAYAQRRPRLAVERREQLALRVEPALRRTMPGVVAERGSLAALDVLADEMTGF